MNLFAEEIYSCFRFLRDVFSDEFIFLPGNAVKVTQLRGERAHACRGGGLQLGHSRLMLVWFLVKGGQGLRSIGGVGGSRSLDPSCSHRAPATCFLTKAPTSTRPPVGRLPG